jgi:glucose/arabinose dehydrogenase
VHISRSFAIIPLVAVALNACGGGDDDGDGGPITPIETEIVAVPVVVSGLIQPVHLAAPPGDERLFVVQLGGVIRIIEDGALLPAPFLDISAKVSIGGERGLLSMAFDPQFATNRRFYVSYTDVDGHSVVERYLASAADPDLADPASAEFIIGVDQPDAVHNGGHILFGPDGHLYVAMGDGGQSSAASRDRTNLLGMLLRIDVRGAAPYLIPADNPYVAHASFRPEIWAYGLRNPWRIAFDVPSSRLYIADVGQDVSEEINIEPVGSAGLDYGWDVMEGDDCYLAATCATAGKVLPKHSYGHEDGRCSISGGEVYRGDAMPDLRGYYFYADLCQDGVRTLRFANGTVTDHRLWPVGDLGLIVSFGRGGDGELYVVSITGSIHKLAPAPAP